MQGNYNRAKRLKYGRSSWKAFFTDQIATIKSNAKLRGLAFSLTATDLLELHAAQSGRCAVTDVELTRTYGEGRVATNSSVDRIDGSKGYFKDNVRLVCDRVNAMRGAGSDCELVKWARSVVQAASKLCATI